MKVTPRSRCSTKYIMMRRRDGISSQKKRLVKKYLTRKSRNMQLMKENNPNIQKRETSENSDHEHTVTSSEPLDHFMIHWIPFSEDDGSNIFATSSSAAMDCSVSQSFAESPKPIYAGRSKLVPKVNVIPYFRPTVFRRVSSFDPSFQQILALFHNCVNFVQPRGSAPVEDVDMVARSFHTFGKVVGIQDHWIEPRGSSVKYPSIWAGATVTYRRIEDVNRVIRAFSVPHTTSRICVSVADHLTRIKEVEDSWIARGDCKNIHGTCVVVIATGMLICRKNLREEFNRYGTTLNIIWNNGRTLHHTCEVTYKSTTNAVAAALGMDGKRLFRCYLRTKIKIRSEKELFIHRTLCSTFQ